MKEYEAIRDSHERRSSSTGPSSRRRDRPLEPGLEAVGISPKGFG